MDEVIRMFNDHGVRYLLNSPADSAYAAVNAQGVITARTPTSAAVPLNVFVFAGGAVHGEQALIQRLMGETPPPEGYPGSPAMRGLGDDPIKRQMLIQALMAR